MYSNRLSEKDSTESEEVIRLEFGLLTCNPIELTVNIRFTKKDREPGGPLLSPGHDKGYRGL